MAKQVVWYDNPVLDLDRAIRSYSAELGATVKRQEFPGTTVGILPHDYGEVKGCLHMSESHRPADTGVLIYLNCDGRLDAPMDAVKANGGSVVQRKRLWGV